MDEDLNYESKYIQQHLANERTYLAWIRTAIAIMGIGFLIMSLHFNTQIGYYLNDIVVLLLSVFTVSLGGVTIAFSTFNYYRNRKRINEQTFRSSHFSVLFITAVMFIVLACFTTYLILL